MKPKQMKSPFSWKERRPAISDSVLYVPAHYDKHHEFCFPGWESKEVFGRNAPLHMEICAGNGDWIVAQAQKYPDENWVAVEIQFDRVRKIWSKKHNQGLKNLFIVCGEGYTFLRHYVAKEAFSAIYVNFPDPWPKKKHEKKRLLSLLFLQELARIGKKGAMLTIVTDHVDYSLQTLSYLNALAAWSPCYPPPYYVTEYPDYGTSYFESLFRLQGMEIRYMQYRLEETV